MAEAAELDKTFGSRDKVSPTLSYCSSVESGMLPVDLREALQAILPVDPSILSTAELDLLSYGSARATARVWGI